MRALPGVLFLKQGSYLKKAFSVIGRWVVKKIIHPVFHRLDHPDYVCYYPAFQRREDLINHYFRARWYLPAYPQACKRVTMVKDFSGDNPQPGERPAYMGQSTGSGDHIVFYGKLNLWSALLQARHILFWQPTIKALDWLFRLAGKRVYYVATEAVDAREYTSYAKILWNMLPEHEREAIVLESKTRFLNYVDGLEKFRYARAYVFGTGPTLEEAYDFDFSDGFRLVCNSIVANPKLLNHIQPHFIAAIDEVSHLGISRYAEKFRADLVEVLRSRNMLFVTIAQNGFILVANHPELRNKTVLIPCQTMPPNYNLLQDFRLPGFVSVLSSTMLPIATTLAKDIRFLGCDGKSKVRNNEDFWAHGKEAQYQVELVNSGHLCHPTFDLHRQAVTYDQYNDELASIILRGEQEYEMKFGCLRPSNTPVLRERLIR